MSDLYIVMCKTGEKEVSSFVVEKGWNIYNKYYNINFRFFNQKW